MPSRLEQFRSRLNAIGYCGGENYLRVDEVLQQLSERSQLRVLLEGVLADPVWLEHVARSSYCHKNGFDKLALISSQGYKLRLHVWWPDPDRPAPGGDDVHMHNHRWDFASVVVCGGLEVNVFERSVEGVTVSEYSYSSPGDGDTYAMRYLGAANIKCALTAFMVAGSRYGLSHQVIHRAISDRTCLTVTLLLQGPVRTMATNVFAVEPIVEGGALEVQRLQVQDVSRKLAAVLAACA